MKINKIKILVALLLSFYILLYTEYEALGNFYFYILLTWGVLDILHRRKIDLIHVWNAAFGFIILSEVFLDVFLYRSQYLAALKYLIIANNIVYIGYVSRIKNIYSKAEKPNNSVNYKPKKITPYILILLLISFFILKINIALASIFEGRIGTSDEGSFILDSIVNALGFILPALIAYYYIIIRKRSVLTAVIISLPIFLIEFIIGTRFPLLFSVLGFVIVALSRYPIIKINIKTSFYVLISIIILLIGSKAMKSFRATGFQTNSQLSLTQINNSNNSLSASVLSLGSPEGVIDMTSLLFDYFDWQTHLYGESTSFILYFWIPRSVWPTKPTMLGHWLVREYRSGFSSGHSTSFGFTGELYADFGLFSLFFVFFIGRLIARANSFKDKAMRSNSYQLVLGAMLFPYTFFFVRSPVTATINFFAILFFYSLFKRLFVTKR